MPTHKTAVFSSPRLRRSLSVSAERRNAKRSKRAAFLRNLSLLLMSSFLTSTLCLVGCALSPKPKLPEVVGETPTFEELQTAVNANSAKIETIFSSDASIGVASTPGWAKCQIAFERPGNLRVVGSAPTMGRVVDVGCNEERFWFWSDFQNSNELYFCRLDQYQNSAASLVLPLDPTWFPEAFGVVELKEDELVDGPTPQGDGSLLVTLKKTRQDGVYLKRIYFEPKTAALLRQDVQSPNGETVVSIRCKRSAYLESSGVVLPQKIEIECPQMDGALIVDVGTPILNDASKIAEKAFQQPNDLNAKAIDLGAYGASASTPAATTSSNAPQNVSATPVAANAPNAVSPALNAPAAPATFETPQTQIRMVARARVEAAAENALAASQTFAAATTVATAQTLEPAPAPSVAPTGTSVYQAPQLAQVAPTAQSPQLAQAAPTTQNAPAFPTPQAAPTFQAPQVAQNAPTPQTELLEAPSLADLDVPFPEEPAQIPQPASALEDFDALLPTDAAEPLLPADFPSVEVPAPIGPAQEVVGAPRAAL